MTRTIFLSPKEIDTLRDNPTAWNPLVSVCDSFADEVSDPAIVFTTSSSYTATGHGTNTMSDRLSIPSAIAYRDALCYLMTGETKYAIHAQKLIDHWYKTLRRIDGVSGQGVIGFHYPMLVIAGDWVRDVNGWDGNGYGEFLSKVLLPQTRIEYKNNVASWWSALTASIHAYNNNYDGLREVVDKWKEQTIEQICMKDGVAPCTSSYTKDITIDDRIWAMPDEITRTDTSNYHAGSDKGIKGLSYSHFGMLAWTICLEVMKKEGLDLYKTTEGRYFQNTFNKLVGWVKTPETFPYANTGTNTVAKLKNKTQCSYFSVLVRRFTSKTDGDADDRALKDARDIIDAGMLPDRWQLDLLHDGVWNPPSGFLDEGN